VDNLDDRVRRTGSLNTIYVRHGKTYATSTDGIGFSENIRWRSPGFSFDGIAVTLLGAGGSARAIIDELLRLNVASISIVNRTFEKAEALAHHFGANVRASHMHDVKELLSTSHLLINTTSAGIADSAGLSLPFAALPATALVADINYVPLITPFLQEAERLGYAIVPGLGMLLHQAVPGFELWFGRRPQVTQELYDLIAADIMYAKAGKTTP
jgi:shikimate dehydrogenase